MPNGKNIVLTLDKYDAMRLHSYMEGVEQKLRRISEWAQEAWCEVEDGDNESIVNAQMKIESIEFLADSMRTEVDLLFGLRMRSVPFALLADLRIELDGEKKEKEKKSEAPNA